MSTTDPGSEPASAPDLFADVRIRHLWGTFVYAIGSSMVGVVAAYTVYKQSNSVAITGLIVVCSILPTLVLPGPATYLARVWGGPKLYVVSRVAIGIVALFPVGLVIAGRLSTASLLVWFLVTGILYALSGSSTGLVRAMIAAPGKVPEFNGDLAKYGSAGTLIGMLSAGFVYAAVGAGWVFLFGAIASVIEGLSVIRVLKRAPLRGQPRERFRIALDVYRNNRGLRATCLFSLWCFVVGGYAVTLPAIASSIGQSAEYLSVLQTATIVGGLFIGWAMGYVHGRFCWGQTQRVCFLIVGVGLVGMAVMLQAKGGATLTLIVVVLMLIPIGFAVNLDMTILGSIIQIFTPEGTRNAVMTGYALIPAIFVPLGQEAIGITADKLSVAGALGILAVIVLVSVVFDPRISLRAAIDSLNESDTPPSHIPTLVHVDDVLGGGDADPS